MKCYDLYELICLDERLKPFGEYDFDFQARDVILVHSLISWVVFHDLFYYIDCF